MLKLKMNSIEPKCNIITLVSYSLPPSIQSQFKRSPHRSHTRTPNIPTEVDDSHQNSGAQFIADIKERSWVLLEFNSANADSSFKRFFHRSLLLNNVAQHLFPSFTSSALQSADSLDVAYLSLGINRGEVGVK